MHYWYWFIAAAALFVLEMFSGTFYLLVASIALLGAGIAAWHQPQSGSLWLVQYRGTYWQAEAPFPAQAGQAARIAGKSGNILILQPLEEN